MPLKIDMDKSPKAQLEALRNRQKLITTSKWNELEKEAHDKAFTVAKVMSADVLQDIYDYVQSAVKEGWSYDTFKKKVRDGGLVERMQNAGWLKTATDKQIGVRLQVIIDTNVKMAYGKGNYNRLMLVKDKKPYWIYHQVERKTKRAEHSIYNGRKFHCDDPIWNTIYPPSGFRCSCWVEAVAEPDGVESGSNIEINPGEHPISPLTAWKPDTLKYVEGIRKLLEDTLFNKMINSFAKEAGLNDPVKMLQGITTYDQKILHLREEYISSLPVKTAESIEWYMGDGYSIINADAREGRYNEDMENITNGDLSFILYNKPLLYRGEKYSKDGVLLNNRLNDILNGRCFNQLISASYDPETASLYGGILMGEECNSIILRINVTSTIQVGLGVPIESEVIFPKGTKYKVKKITKHDVKKLIKYIIDLDVFKDP